MNRINLLEKDLYMLNLSKEDKHIIINIKFENMNYSKLKKFLKNSERYLPNYSFKRFIILKNFNLIIVCRNLKDEKLSIIIDYIKNFFKTNFDKENYHIGISKNVSGYENIFKSYNRTVTTINILKRMENKNIGFYEDFILYDFMFDISNIESVNNLKELTFDKLLKYDSKNNTNFFKSLYEYVDSDFNVNKAADKLFIHRNTMYNRLNKISKILDIDLNESSNRFILQLVKSIEKIK